MSVSIVSRTISAVVDKRIVLASSQIGRKMTIGSTWTTLRIAIRAAIDPTLSTTNILGALLQIGVCSGTTAMIGHSSTTHWFGLNLSPSGGQTGYTFTYAAGPPVSFQAASSGAVPTKRVGSTYTYGATSFGQNTTLPGAPGSYRGLIVIEINKISSISTSIQSLTATTVTPTGVDVSSTQLIQVLEAGTMANVATLMGVGYTANGVGSLATSESTSGYWDTINIAWSITSRPLEISDVAFARIL